MLRLNVSYYTFFPKLFPQYVYVENCTVGCILCLISINEKLFVIITYYNLVRQKSSDMYLLVSTVESQKKFEKK